jgi:hypothetical protein
MATLQQVREDLVDKILKITVAKSGIDVSQYRRTISSGQISVPSTESAGMYNQTSPEVIYQEDYQTSQLQFDTTINYVVNNCLQNGTDYDFVEYVNLSYVKADGQSRNFRDDQPWQSDYIDFSGIGGADENRTACSADDLGVPDIVPFLSQFFTFEETQTDINTDVARDILDTNIFELLPGNLTRQQEIDNFFKEYNRLKGEIPFFDDIPTPDGNPVEGDGLLDALAYDPEGSTDLADYIPYDPQHDIVEFTNPYEGFITRLDESVPMGNTNVNKTLEWLYEDVKLFLDDKLQDEGEEFEDVRPTYQNKSSGYLKIRNLNQSIIIRNGESENIGMENWETDGFTITMWVRFKDRVNGGTLFNYGNPLRGKDPVGFKLETFVVNKNDEFPEIEWPTYGDYVTSKNVWTQDSGSPFFSDNDYERFVRLVVKETDENETLRDSHVGISYDSGGDRTEVSPVDIAGFTDAGLTESNRLAGMLTYTRIPIDFDEWYFIVASYDPTVKEDDSFDLAIESCPETTIFHPSYNTAHCLKNPDFWRGNIDPIYGYVPTYHSGYGARCKVEVISKTQLITARGFKL